MFIILLLVIIFIILMFKNITQHLNKIYDEHHQLDVFEMEPTSFPNFYNGKYK